MNTRFLAVLASVALGMGSAAAGSLTVFQSTGDIDEDIIGIASTAQSEHARFNPSMEKGDNLIVFQSTGDVDEEYTGRAPSEQAEFARFEPSVEQGDNLIIFQSTGDVDEEYQGR